MTEDEHLIVPTFEIGDVWVLSHLVGKIFSEVIKQVNFIFFDKQVDEMTKWKFQGFEEELEIVVFDAETDKFPQRS